MAERSPDAALPASSPPASQLRDRRRSLAPRKNGDFGRLSSRFRGVEADAAEAMDASAVVAIDAQEEEGGFPLSPLRNNKSC
ncbi:hypothetical protein NL676_015783 [Syzygium grande]|nr:hypothetical protein NL676_015783 [Syzygium grande]